MCAHVQCGWNVLVICTNHYLTESGWEQEGGGAVGGAEWVACVAVLWGELWEGGCGPDVWEAVCGGSSVGAVAQRCGEVVCVWGGGGSCVC